MASDPWDVVVARAVKRARRYRLKASELERLKADIRRGCDTARALGFGAEQVRVSLESDRPGHCRMVCYSVFSDPRPPGSRAVH